MSVPPQFCFGHIFVGLWHEDSHEDVTVIKERAPQPGHTIHLRAMPRGGDSERNEQALARAASVAPNLKSDPPDHNL
jgi:hypothetical protein